MKNVIDTRVDVLVVGAGTGGCAAASAAAAEGLAVALVDRKPVDQIGRKTCGDALTGDGLAAVSRHIAPPEGAEIANRLDSGLLVLGHTGSALDLTGSGIVLNRLLFGQRMLADAVAAGVELVTDCSCVGWNDRSAGSVRLRPAEGDEFEVAPRVVIDASGYGGVLTGRDGPLGSDHASRHDVGIGYREILPLSAPLERPTRGEVVLAPAEARRGYAWVFPVSDRLVNVGIGAPYAAIGHGLRDAYRAFVEGRRDLSHSEPLSSGAGMLPLRRPLASLVGDGFMSVGDAGCQTNPLHGGGIAPSIIGGSLAGRTAAEAVASGDASARALWKYNIEFAKEIGVDHAVHEVVRDLLYSLGPSDFEFLAEGLAELNFRSATAGAALSRRQLAALLGRAARRPLLASRVARAVSLITATRRHYGRMPSSPDGFEGWYARFDRLRRASAPAER